jgi:hypothetical protein
MSAKGLMSPGFLREDLAKNSKSGASLIEAAMRRLLVVRRGTIASRP